MNSSSTTTQALDPDVVAMLRDLANDESFLVELLDAYVESSAASLTDIDRSLASGDTVKIQEAAHSLKGASGNVGAAGLQALCEELENHADSAGREEIESLVARMNDEFDRVRTEIDKELSRPPGAS